MGETLTRFVKSWPFELDFPPEGHGVQFFLPLPQIYLGFIITELMLSLILIQNRSDHYLGQREEALVSHRYGLNPTLLLPSDIGQVAELLCVFISLSIKCEYTT